MTDLNSVVVVGRITKDCNSENGSFGYLQSGAAIAKISVAVNRSRKNQTGEWQDEASFFNVAIFGKLAEGLQPKLKKGVQVAVAGFLKQERWQKDGQNFSSVSIVADSVQVFTPKQVTEEANSDFIPRNMKDTIKPMQQTQMMPQNNFQTDQNQQFQQNYQNGGEFPENIPF